MMDIKEYFSLKDYNTFSIDATCRYFVESDVEEDFVDFRCWISDFMQIRKTLRLHLWLAAFPPCSLANLLAFSKASVQVANRF